MAGDARTVRTTTAPPYAYSYYPAPYVSYYSAAPSYAYYSAAPYYTNYPAPYTTYYAPRTMRRGHIITAHAGTAAGRSERGKLLR